MADGARTKRLNVRNENDEKGICSIYGYTIIKYLPMNYEIYSVSIDSIQVSHTSQLLSSFISS